MDKKGLEADMESTHLEQLFETLQTKVGLADNGQLSSEGISEANHVASQCQRLLSAQALFSRNETVEDVPSENLKYILTDLYAGMLLQKQTFRDPRDRLRMLEAADASLQAFLNRCVSLEVVTSAEQKLLEESTLDVDAAKRRSMKIGRFKLCRDLKQKYEELAENYQSSTARELILFNLRIKYFEALDEVDSIAQERDMLDRMTNLVGEGQDERVRQRLPVDQAGGVSTAPFAFTAEEYANRPGLQVTRIDPDGKITREQIKASVTMPFHRPPTMSLKELADIEMQSAQQRESQPSESAPKKYAQLEEEGLEDDEALVDQATIRERNWDDWKDDNPKGIGNKGANIY